MAVITHKDVATGIRAKLYANASILAACGARIYHGVPGKNSTFPFIRIQAQADGRDIQTLGARHFQYFVMSVIAVSQNADTADVLNGYIDTALERTALTISGGRHSVTKRLAPIWYQENGADEYIYTHAGGIYEIGVRAT